MADETSGEIIKMFATPTNKTIGASNIKMDFTKLGKALETLLKTRNYEVHVGIFGNKNARGTAGQRTGVVELGGAHGSTNAEIGYLQENGYTTSLWVDGEAHRDVVVPARSFLKVPIRLHGGKIFADAQTVFVNALMEGKLERWYKTLGILARRVVDDTFEDNDWPRNSPWWAAHKGSDKPLIDTGALRRSISSRVVKGE